MQLNELGEILHQLNLGRTAKSYIPGHLPNSFLHPSSQLEQPKQQQRVNPKMVGPRSGWFPSTGPTIKFASISQWVIPSQQGIQTFSF